MALLGFVTTALLLLLCAAPCPALMPRSPDIRDDPNAVLRRLHAVLPGGLPLAERASDSDAAMDDDTSDHSPGGMPGGGGGGHGGMPGGGGGGHGSMPGGGGGSGHGGMPGGGGNGSMPGGGGNGSMPGGGGNGSMPGGGGNGSMPGGGGNGSMPGDGHGDDDGMPSGTDEPMPPNPPNRCPKSAPTAAGFLTGTHSGAPHTSFIQDPRLSFFRFAFGWDVARVAAEQKLAEEHLNAQMNVTGTTAAFKLQPLFLDATLRLVAYSNSRGRQCGEVRAVMGALLAIGTNVSYGGPFAEAVGAMTPDGRVMADTDVEGGLSAAGVFYLVVRPGTPGVIKLRLTAARPFMCARSRVCGFEGAIEFVEHATMTGQVGRAVATSVETVMPDGNMLSQYVINFVFPGFLPPELM